MAISPISFPTAPVPGVTGVTPSMAPAATDPTAPVDGGFGAILAASADQLNVAHAKTDALGVQAATGDLRDVHDYMIASTEAALATDMVVTIRNKGVEAFNEIMRMQV